MQQPFSASSASPPGDDLPVARLFADHAPAIFAYVRSRTTTSEEAEDLLLDVFLAAIEQSETLENRTSESQRAWLRTVAAHKVSDHYRHRKRRPQVTLEEVAETLYTDEAYSPESVAIQRERDDQLRALLERLPSHTRQLIQLRFVYGLGSAAIAAVLGAREGAVRKQLWRALNQIRVLFHDE